MKPLRFLILALMASGGLRGVALDPLIGDDMVLQRERPIVIRGTAKAGETVQVRLGNDQARVTADATGAWEARLRPRSASSSPLTLVAKGASGESTARNLLVGDVWVCAGQSNMEWPLRLDSNAPEAARMLKAPNRQVRLRNHSFPGQYSKAALNPQQLADLRPGRFFKGAWGEDGPKVSPPFSAVGWWFAQRVQAAVKVPIGMVNWSIGGAPIETFIRPEVMAAEAGLAAKLAGDWERNPAIDGWVRKRAREHFGKAQEPRDARGIDHFYKPGFAWAAGPGLATWMPVKGVLWYQGESNSLSEPFVREYPALMRAMVADWRAQWGQPEMPFLWVQLSSIDTRAYKSQEWPRFRDNQRRLLDEIPNSGMAVSSDVGAQNDVHPRDKRTVGERLARWALHHIYGQRQVVPSGPLALGATAGGSSVTVRFAHGRGLRTRDGKAVLEVEVAGTDGIYAAAEAEIRGETLVIKAAGGKPAKVRYGWVPWSQGNLVNGEGLPASTFEVEVK
jgi:sialate O-acetylesterase